MRTTFRKDMRGGAVVELAICTVVIVPLVLYANWFADVAHWKIKVEEASIAPVMDLTAWKVNHLTNTSTTFTGLYDNAMKGSKRLTLTKYGMQSSFDSAKPTAATFNSALFVRPKNLDVECRYHSADPSPGPYLGIQAINNRLVSMNDSRPNQNVPEFNTKTWVTCRSQAHLTTNTLIPRKFEGKLLSPGSTGFTTFKVCGVGPGVTGCGSGNVDGLTVMLDDWHVDNGWDIPLSMIRYTNANNPANETTPTGVVDSAVNTNRRDVEYFKLAMRYWRKPLPGNDVVGNVMWDVAHSSEMGYTDWFHLSYRYYADHSYDARETRDGQKGAYGGPDDAAGNIYQESPHTGGPWHERDPGWFWAYGTHFSGVDNAEDWSVQSYYFHRDNRYMGMPGWPVDK